ncbi:MAG: hypothetical protein AB1668_05865 [Nanoarchaeota archaeon]
MLIRQEQECAGMKVDVEKNNMNEERKRFSTGHYTGNKWGGKYLRAPDIFYIEVKYADETVWLTQKMMAKLFQVSIPTVNEHLRNIYFTKELDEKSTIRKFLIVQTEANRQVQREMKN